MKKCQDIELDQLLTDDMIDQIIAEALSHTSSEEPPSEKPSSTKAIPEDSAVRKRVLEILKQGTSIEDLQLIGDKSKLVPSDESLCDKETYLCLDFE